MSDGDSGDDDNDDDYDSENDSNDNNSNNSDSECVEGSVESGFTLLRCRRRVRNVIESDTDSDESNA